MFYVGVDLGRQQDHSAIAVVERIAGRTERVLRGIKRIPLGTPYAEVLEQLRRTTQSPRLEGNCRAVVDATGLGAPVVEMLKHNGLGCETYAVTITAGDKARSLGWQGGALWWNVPKQDLVGRVQVLLEREELRIPRKLSEVGSLLRELRAMRTDTTERGRRKTSAHGSEHDDLVMAIALACWLASQSTIGFRGQQL